MGITSPTPQDLSEILVTPFLDQASNRHDLTPVEVAAARLCAKPEPGHRFNEVQESYLFQKSKTISNEVNRYDSSGLRFIPGSKRIAFQTPNAASPWLPLMLRHLTFNAFLRRVTASLQTSSTSCPTFPTFNKKTAKVVQLLNYAERFKSNKWTEHDETTSALQLMLLLEESRMNWDAKLPVGSIT